MEDKCLTCGAQLLRGTSFCRKCGASIFPNQAEGASEKPTSLLSATDPALTQRLDSRPTGNPNEPAEVDPSLSPAVPGTLKGLKGRYAIIGSIFTLIIIATLCVVGFVALKRHASNEAVSYPGARIITDMKYDDGSRALTLETNDGLETVEAWYQKRLKPLKTMRLNPHSVVIKNEKTTATIVADGNTTDILIKMAP